jgi:hypothetical protein
MVFMTEQKEDNKEQEINLEELAKKIVEALEVAGAGKIYDKGKTEKAQYDIGTALSQAKKLFNGSKRKFGEWRKENIVGNGKRIVDSKTLGRWSELCEFGTLEQCQTVGFTNVYKLSTKPFAELRTKILEKLVAEPDAGSDVYSEMVKERVDEIKASKEVDKANKDKELTAKVAELEARISELESDNAKLREQLSEHATEEDSVPSEVAESV